MKRLPFLTFALVLCAGACQANEAQVVHSRQSFKVDGVEVSLGKDNGYAVTVDGFTFTRMGQLFLVDPAWKHTYYSYRSDAGRLPNMKVEDLPGGGKRLTMPLHADSGVMEATQTLELKAGRRLTVALDMRKTTSVPVVIENRVAAIGEGWLSNREFSARMKDGGTTTGRVTAWAPSSKPLESKVVEDFARMEVKLPQGEMGISTTATAPLSLVDYRRNEWAEGQKYFWFGVLGSPVPDDGVLHYEVEFEFPKAAQKKTAALEGKAAVKPLASAYQSPAVEDRIIPTPKSLKWNKDNIALKGSTLELSISGSGGVAVADVMFNFEKRMERVYGLKLNRAADGEGAVRIKVDVQEAAEGDLRWREGYAIRSTESYLALDDIHTTFALHNALATLEQLIRYDNAGKVSLRRVDLTDWPSLEFRGIHFFTGRNARDLQLHMVEDVLAPLKINRLVYQVDYMRWDSQSEIFSPVYGMEKADAKAVADAAERDGIDVIPLVNTFGHSEWLLQRPHMRKYADDPNDPFAYDPSNPEVYKICEAIYREAIALFQPSVMHIGHDEVSMDGFPRKPENKAVGATQLLINDTIHYRDFLAKLGIKTMIWGDMFLAPGEAPDATLAPSKEEAARRRSLLPKDIMIADWHYKAAPTADYKSLQIFGEAGFNTVACTWNAPDNIMHFANAAEKAAEKGHSRGLMQTTWAGYSFDENSLAENLPQYAAYVLAAEAAWTGGSDSSSGAPFDVEAEFLRRWNGDVRGGETGRGVALNLTDVATHALKEKELGLAPGALHGLKPGTMRMGGFAFDVAGKDGQPAAVWLGGYLDEAQAQSVVVPVLSKAREIVLALATPYATPDGTDVGQLSVTYKDGSVTTAALEYGKNVLSITDSRQTLYAPAIWKSVKVPQNEGAVVVHALRWKNPRPEAEIERVELGSDAAGPGLLLLGATGVGE